MSAYTSCTHPALETSSLVDMKCYCRGSWATFMRSKERATAWPHVKYYLLEEGRGGKSSINCNSPKARWSHCSHFYQAAYLLSFLPVIRLSSPGDRQQTVTNQSVFLVGNFSKERLPQFWFWYFLVLGIASITWSQMKLLQIFGYQRPFYVNLYLYLYIHIHITHGKEIKKH